MATEKKRRVKAPDPEQLEKEVKVINLRMAGVTWAEIANQLGYSGPSSAYYTYQKAAERMVRPGLEEYRDLELDRLDRLQRGVWVAAVSGDVKSVDAVLRIIDRRARLLGLNAPEKVQAEIVTYDGEALEQRTQQLIEILRANSGETRALGSGVSEDGTDP